MFSKKNRVRKIFATSLLFLTFQSSAHAADDGALAALLQDIRTHTRAILERVNNLPSYLQIFGEAAREWVTKTDDSKSIAVNGSYFSLLAQLKNLDLQNQISQTKNLTLSFLGNKNKLNINNLSYTTLLDAPLVTPDKATGPLATSKDAYIKTIAGSSLPLNAPDPIWRTGGQDRQDYYNLYTTIAAVQSYNAYIINKINSERQQRATYPAGLPNRRQGDPVSTADVLAASIENASDANWYTQIGSEPIGMVLRQILVFSSQNFILLKKMLETQQDALMAQAMTNTLLMQSQGLGQGRTLYRQATGTLTQ